MVLLERTVHELIYYWGRPPATVRDQTRGQSQRLEGYQPAECQHRLNPDIDGALLAAEYE